MPLPRGPTCPRRNDGSAVDPASSAPEQIKLRRLPPGRSPHGAGGGPAARKASSASAVRSSSAPNTSNIGSTWLIWLVIAAYFASSTSPSATQWIDSSATAVHGGSAP